MCPETAPPGHGVTATAIIELCSGTAELGIVLSSIYATYAVGSLRKSLYIISFLLFFIFIILFSLFVN